MNNRDDGPAAPTQTDLPRDASGAQRDPRTERHCFLEAMVECSTDAITGQGLDGTILTWNMGAERLYGYSHREAVGRHVGFLTPPERAGEVESLVERVKCGHLVQDYETIRLKKDGTRVDLAITVSPIRDTAGTIIGISSIARDITGRKKAEAQIGRLDSFPEMDPSPTIEMDAAGSFVFANPSLALDVTERKQAEEALRQQREWLRVTLTSIGDGVLATDAVGRVMFLNPVAAALTGWDEAEALGKPAREVFQIINEETSRRAEDIIGRVLREGCTVSLANHTALVARDGRQTPIEDSAAPIRDNRGNVAGAVLVFHDVTEKRRAQEALRESEQRVRHKLDSILSPEGDIGSLELRDIIDVQAMQSLLNNLYELVHMPMSIVDLRGNTLVGVGWQDVCTKFHWVHPESCKQCIESDTQLSAGVPPGECRLYRCRNNMWDVATPMTIGGRHVGNLFSGQFFLEDELPDYELFRAQARNYGFDEREYLAALDRVPRLSRDFVKSGMAFLMQLGHMLSLLSYGNIKLARSLSEREALMFSLQESEERLNRAQAVAHLGSWEFDVPNNQLFWSDEVYRIFGIEPHDFGETSEAFLEAVHPDDREAVSREYARSLEEGQPPYEIEHRVIRKDGEVRWVHEKCSHLRDTAGAITRSIGTVQDITDRRQAEEVLRQASEHRRLALEAAELGAWDYRFDRGEVFWDERCRNLFGITGGARVSYEEAISCIHPEDRPAVAEAVEQALAGTDGGAYHREFRVVWPDGSLHWVASHGRVYFEGEGDPRRPARFVGVNMDITVRKQLEEQLRQSAEETHKLMDIAPVAIWVARDPQCDQISGNRTANEFYEAGRGENVSANALPLRRFFRNGRELAPGELPMQEAAARGTDIRDSELEVLLPSGKRIHMLGHASPLRDSDGQVRGCVGAFLDITDRKQSEQRLRQAQKMESLGLLAGGVAHDFNNLLVGVIGNACLAKDQLPPGHPATDLLERVVKAGEHAAHLTRQMLAYSGKGRFVVEPLNLSDLIPEMTGLVHPAISKKIALQLELEPGLPAVEADRGQIQQVFMNLVLNAAEAIGSDSGLITVRTGVQNIQGQSDPFNIEADLRAGKYVCLEVHDTGSGMDEATRARIFDPFFSTKFTGRGLGLAAVAGIVRGHKGAIRVTSVPGQGSCFTVLFPATERAAAAPAVTTARARLQGSGTVLVVDDEEIVRELAKNSLERYGYRVLLAESGAAAIDILKRVPDPISVVLLDLSMPGMTGEEALSELLKMRPTLRVLISSGYSEAETLRLFGGLPVAGFLQKPYTSTRLAEKVKSALAG